MPRYLLTRLGTSLLAVLGVVVLVFFIVRVLPGDPAAVRAGQYATAEELARIRAAYGLDRPLWKQFMIYLHEVSRADLGVSIKTDQKVRDEILDRLPASLELAFYSVLLASLVGIPLGIVAAANRGSWIDLSARMCAVLGSSMALFWLGLLLIYFFFFRLHWFPGPVGRLPIGAEFPARVTGFLTVDALLAGQPALAGTALRYLALPVITMGFVVAAPILKMVRASMIDALDSAYVRTARAVGVPRRQILLVDGFRNALVPVTTTLGIVFGYMLGGNIIVETLFSWPGVGKYAYDALRVNDLQALQGFVIVVGVLSVALNVLIDLAYAWIDPRIRLTGTVGE